VSLRIPSSSRSPDHDPHRTIYYLGYPLGRFAGLKHRHQGRLLPTPSRSLAGARAAAATAAGRRRFPRRRAPLPNSGYTQVLGELARASPPFPGRESRLSRRNPGESAASHGQGPNCRARNLSRVFCVN
jgi:hypothetical protein